MSASDYKTKSFGYITALNYALAGDMESVDLLAQLSERLHLIQWDDPVFIQLSDEMRAPLHRLTPDQEVELQPSLRSLLHLQNEQIAEIEEAASSHIAVMRRAIEQQKIKDELDRQVLSLLQVLVGLHQRMRDKLQMLGADVAEYDIPPEALPKSRPS